MDEQGMARVVVIGAGFGGLTFCKEFQHSHARVTVVDRTNHHLFQPLLYQVATAGLSAPDIAQPIRSILSRTPRVEVFMDKATGFDLEARRVCCEHHTLEYDYLVLALGGVTSYFKNPEWERWAPGLKTLEDALSIRSSILLAFERAENERDPALQEQLMTIVIVGGGPTGVEVAGACAELAHRVLRRDFDHIDPRRARVIVVEASSCVLSHLPPDLSEKAQRQLEGLGVDVRNNCKVKEISPGCVVLDTGEVLRAGNVIWAAGVRAHPLTGKLGVELDRAGRVKVQPDLSLPGHPEVFAIGDMAAVTRPDGTPVPGVAPAAMQMARYVAKAISHRLDHSGADAGLPPFRYKDKGTLATIGRSAGVAQFGSLKLSGFIAWIAWLLIHLIFLIGFKNKITVLISWAYSYLTFKLGARLITGAPERDHSNVGVSDSREPDRAQVLNAC